MPGDTTMPATHALTDQEAQFLTLFFTDHWSSSSLWDYCCDAARTGLDDACIRAEFLEGDAAVDFARKIGIIDDHWVESLFRTLALIRQESTARN